MDQALEKLFESVSKVKLLKLFLMNPEQEFTHSEVVKHTQLKSPAVKKELAKLLKMSLVKSKIITIPEVKKMAAKKPTKRKTAKKGIKRKKREIKTFKVKSKTKKRK